MTRSVILFHLNVALLLLPSGGFSLSGYSDIPWLESPPREVTASLAALETANADTSSEAVIRALYDLVTFPAGTTPDWDKVRSLFIPEAVIVLRSSRTAQSVFSVDGFVQDFVNFIERAEVVKTGFEEKIVNVKLTEFGDIAHAFVIYEARIPERMPKPQTGVDSFQLIRQDGQWKIASITNELPTPERPLPDEIKH